MRIPHVISICLFLSTFINGVGQTYMAEGFETGSRPEGWTEQGVVGDEPWRYRNGGHSPNDNNWLIPADEVDIRRNPDGAFEGTYNAIFFKQGFNNERTKLITPPIDLVGGVSIELSFYLCQIPWTFEGSTGWDILRVYYKAAEEDPWQLLHEFLDPVYDWELQKLLLPDPSSTYFIAFEGQTRWGYGTCIDDVKIEETGTLPMFISDVEFEQPFTNYVPSGSKKVPLLRSDYRVFGNTDSVMMDVIEITSLNTNDADISPGSLKLYFTENQIFHTDNPLGNPTSFSGGKALFTDINFKMPRGTSYIWLTCDIELDAAHGNVIDVMVASNSIQASGQTFPASNQSPPGDRTVYETLYKQDFEGVNDWLLTGEFEVGVPSGLGGSPGNPDPDTAFSGTKILGTDLTGIGANPYNYEPGLSDASSYLATSPTIDALYYKNLNVFFRRFMNIEVWDKSALEVSTDGGISWNSAWQSTSYLSDFQWTEEQIEIPEEFSKTGQFQVRYKLGPTDGANNYSGWNIDDIFITGEFISKDVGISEWIYPQSGSGHSASDSVILKIHNYGGADIVDPVPIAFSLNGGANWTVAQMNTDIPVGGDVIFTFPNPVDLSVPGSYPSVLAKTFMPGDQDLSNDQIYNTLYIVPTFNLPYAENFEANDGYWRSSGDMWEYGTPLGSEISGAASGDKAWVTSLSAQYGQIVAKEGQLIFEDNFETDLGWELTKEFERDIPSNLNAPYFAYSGLYCLGTDLTGLGSKPYLYENGITPEFPHTATSPTLDVSNYSNLVLNFGRWLELQTGDSVKIEVSDDNGISWNTVWKNSTGVSDSDFTFYQYSIPDALTNTSSFKIRFSLFSSSTDGATRAGFNIDDLKLTGDLITLEPAELISPSFDLTGISDPIFEAKIWYDSEAGVDGATMYYTLNEGITWEHINNSSEFDSYWNWYTGNPVSSLGADGWSGQSSDWIQVNHLLPAAVLDEKNVQLKLEFYYNKSSNQFDGIGFDDMKIKDAPFDVGILDILAPSTTCELSSREKFTLRFKNFGISDLQAGDSIQVSYLVDHEGDIQTANEFVILSQVLPKNGTVDLTLESEFDFNSSGDYSAMVYTIDSDPYFYQEQANDTILKLISVNKPFVDLGPDISTVSPDTVILRAYAGEPGNTYLWQDGSSNSTFNVPMEGTYSVIVTNAMNCKAYDTIQVLQLVVDVGVSNYFGPLSACELENSLPIQIAINNFGTDTIEVNDTIFIYADVNLSNIFTDTLVMTSRIVPGESINYTYSDNYDFSSPGIYNLRLYTRLKDDNTSLNDTLNYQLEVYGYPDIDLGPDTTVTAAKYILAPTPGYFEYTWQDGSTEETLTITQPGFSKIFVTVSDEHQCSSYDEVDVTLNIKDVAIDEILSPASSCEVTNSITVSLKIKNEGNQAIKSGESIDIGYIMNAGTPVNESLLLGADLAPASTLVYTFSVSESVTSGEWYDFEIYLSYPGDVKSFNDTVLKSVGVYAPPTIDLGDPFQVIAAFEHTLDAGAGFASYLWQDGSTGQTFTINTPGVGLYGVTVTDVNGCEHYEEVQILLVIPDIGVTEVVSPTTACSLSSEEFIEVAIKNFASSAIDASANISVAYSLNNGTEVIENIVLTGDFEGGSTIYHTFADPVDFSTPGLYQIIAYTIYDSDLVPGNDIVFVNIDVLGAPSVNLGEGEDTISINSPITLSVESGYLSYLWQDGSTSNEFSIPDPSAGMYSVIVTGGNGCITRDSLFVIYDIPDLAITSIASPESSCELGSSTTVALEIANEGYFRISTLAELIMTYSVDGGSSVIETITLGTELPPGESRIVPFTTPYDFSEVNSYEVTASLIYKPDTDILDNMISNTVSVWGIPDVVIGDGSDLIRTNLPYTLIVPSGFESYLWQDNSVGNSYEADAYGWYKVAVTDANGCVGYDSVQVDFPLSSEEKELNSGDVSIFPNPADEYVHVNIDNDVRLRGTFELYNMLNEVVYQKRFTHSKHSSYTINVQELSPGSYHLHIIVDEVPHVFLVIII